MHELIRTTTEDEYKIAATLFTEYANWLNIDLCFQNFHEELKQLKTMYGPPVGGIILAKKEEMFIGCIAVRKMKNDIAELKRMYVKPLYHHKGIGTSLLKEALLLAQKTGYKKIQLDTLNDMTSAMMLYKKNGFYEIPPYYFNPEKKAIYFEKIL